MNARKTQASSIRISSSGQLGTGRNAPASVDSAVSSAQKRRSPEVSADSPARKKTKAVRQMEDAAAERAKRLAALEKRAADASTRSRLSEFECAICFEEFKSKAVPEGCHRVACVPCGHAMYCAGCAAQFRRCPQGCDGAFQGVIKLYL